MSSTEDTAWIFESPDGGKTVTKRRMGHTKKHAVWEIEIDYNDPEIKKGLGIDMLQRIKYIGKQKQK